jgi:hypothetical protein
VAAGNHGIKKKKKVHQFGVRAAWKADTVTWWPFSTTHWVMAVIRGLGPWLTAWGLWCGALVHGWVMDVMWGLGPWPTDEDSCDVERAWSMAHWMTDWTLHAHHQSYQWLIKSTHTGDKRLTFWGYRSVTACILSIYWALGSISSTKQTKTM